DGRVLEGEFGIHPLELGVLRLELLQPLELGDRGPGILRPPLKVGRLADVVLAQDLGNRDARLALLQDLDDLAFREPRLSHGHLLGPGKSTIKMSTEGGSLRTPRPSPRCRGPGSRPARHSRSISGRARSGSPAGSGAIGSTRSRAGTTERWTLASSSRAPVPPDRTEDGDVAPRVARAPPWAF